MNHLAHLFLSAPGTESLIGNLSGDFVRGRLGDRFTPGIRDGIMQHRKLDAFTDAHPSVGAFRRVIANEHGHYARVIADMFIDHFLACHFDEYANESLEGFVARTFATLDPYADTFPGMLRFVYPRMRDEEWLISYRDVEGIHTALTNISRRFSRAPQLASATHLLIDARAELEHRFHQFFRDVIEYARR